jgi:hypothetical protein
VDQRAEADLAENMRQVREQASRQRQKYALSSAASPRRNCQTAEDISVLQLVGFSLIILVRILVVRQL